MKRVFVIVLVFISIQSICQIKSIEKNSLRHLAVRLPATIINGDTVGIVDMSEVLVSRQRVFANCTDAANFYILESNIKVVYPYAVMAQATYSQCEETLNTITDKGEKKRYLKQVQKELMDQYETELKGLTVEQGKLLIKLIDRETGNTSYDIVKEMKGSLSAFMWQTVATLFGNNMKDTYDPTGQDKDIETILHLIERGDI
ncbi:MAG TPA: DUF4294 domain-containing protein [Bacteroidia bacterium]|jgi:hypothetical protein|nr:DUF4294 domain-containing protein [Bacteroidia bacterium]